MASAAAVWRSSWNRSSPTCLTRLRPHAPEVRAPEGRALGPRECESGGLNGRPGEVLAEDVDQERRQAHCANAGACLRRPELDVAAELKQLAIDADGSSQEVHVVQARPTSPPHRRPTYAAERTMGR